MEGYFFWLLRAVKSSKLEFPILLLVLYIFVAHINNKLFTIGLWEDVTISFFALKSCKFKVVFKAHTYFVALIIFIYLES